MPGPATTLSSVWGQFFPRGFDVIFAAWWSWVTAWDKRTMYQRFPTLHHHCASSTSLRMQCRWHCKGMKMLSNSSTSGKSQDIRMLMAGIDVQLGENVVEIRRTQKDEMIFQWKNYSSVRILDYQKIVTKSLGYETNVELSYWRQAGVECKNLDEITTEKDM